MEPTQHTPNSEAPDRTPRPHPFADRPATQPDCARDYRAGADVRAAMDEQRARGRS